MAPWNAGWLTGALPVGLLLGIATCGDPTEVAGRQDILIIGNSLVFELGETVAGIASLDGRDVAAVSAAIGGSALIDHVTGGNARSNLDGEHWSAVVLSQGPTWHAVCRDTLVLAAELLDASVRGAGARPMLLMTWPAATDSANGTWDRVRGSFQAAARAVDGVFIPAGEAWRLAWTADPSLALYGPDGYHPAPVGTFLAGLTVYERVTGRDARALPPVAVFGRERLAIPEATVRLLQEAAHGANQQFGDGTVSSPPGLPTSGPFRC